MARASMNRRQRRRHVVFVLAPLRGRKQVGDEARHVVVFHAVACMLINGCAVGAAESRCAIASAIHSVDVEEQ